MKIYYFIIVMSFFSLNLKSQITRLEATEVAKEYIDFLNLRDYILYSYPEIMNPKSEIITFDKTLFSEDNSSFTFFIDKEPLKNWAHSCSFLFINKNTGQVVEKEWKLPPNNLEDWDILTEIKEESEIKLFNLRNYNSSYSRMTSLNNSENCYAVILSGGYNSSSNWQRYWNDCAAIYSALTNVYDYRDDHIYVIMSDGTNPAIDRHINGGYDSSPLDLDGDGDNDIQFSATKTNISSVFNNLSAIMDSNDHLFIFVTDHGGRTTGQNAYIYLWGETMTDSQFATEVNKINAGQISIVMEQCYSGGFIDNLSGFNRVITTACNYDETSCGMGYYTYNEFVFDWISAIAGKDPYGNIINADENSDGFITMQEAFNYAKENDSCSETPQYSSNPSNLGTRLATDGLIFPISGSSTICDQGTYTVENLPAGAAVTWSASNNCVSLISGQGTNSAVFYQRCLGGSTVQIQAQVSLNGTITNLSRSVSMCDFTFTGSDEIPIGGTEVYTVTPNISSCTYVWEIEKGSQNCTQVINGNINTITFHNRGLYDLSCMVINSSGDGIGEFYIQVIVDDAFFRLSPNPTSMGSVTIDMEDDDSKTQTLKSSVNTWGNVLTSTEENYQIQLWNSFGLVKTVQTNQKSYQLDLSGVPAGFYYVHVIKNGKTYRKRLIVSK